MDVNVDCFLRQTSCFEHGSHPVDESIPPIGIGVVEFFSPTSEAADEFLRVRDIDWTGLTRSGLSRREGELVIEKRSWGS